MRLASSASPRRWRSARGRSSPTPSRAATPRRTTAPFSSATPTRGARSYRAEALELASPALAHEHVHGALALLVPCDLVAEGAQVEPFEKLLALAEQHGAHDEVHLVDEPGFEILADRRLAAAQAHIAALGRSLRAIQRGVA